MLKLLVVDDEYYFRQSLKSILPYEELGYQICGEAKNGQEGLRVIRLLQPDVVVVDITMPVMDGLEMITTLRQEGLQTEFIILTGYEEFQFARTAIKLNVDQYLLKPVDQDEFKNALINIRRKRELRANHDSYINSLQSKIAAMSPYADAVFLSKLLEEGLSMQHDQIKCKLLELGLNVGDPPYQVVVIARKDTHDDYFLQGVEAELARHIPAECKYLFCAIHGRVSLVLSDAVPACQSAFIDALKQTARSLNQKGCLGFFGVSNSIFDLNGCSLASKQAMSAEICGRFYDDPDMVVSFSQLPVRYPERLVLTSEIKNSLLISLRTNARDSIRETLDMLFQGIRQSPIGINSLKMTCSELLSVCYEFCNEVRADKVDVPAADAFFDGIRFFSDLQVQVIDLYFQAMQTAHNNKTTHAASIVEEIKQLIHENYQCADFRVSQISQHLFLNYSHICHVFSQYTGMTISDYLTDTRIARAKALFDEGFLTVSAVAEKVGYNDANYFGKCFKKRYGLSPQKYCQLRDSKP